MKVVFSAVAALIVFASCSGSADKKVPELANEMCGCFDNMQKSYSEDVIKLLKEVSVAAEPQQALMNGMSKLKPEDAKKLTETLAEMSDKNTAVFKCLEAFDKKHAAETTTNRMQLTEKLLTQMQQQVNCPAGAAIVNLGFSKQKKTAAK